MNNNLKLILSSFIRQESTNDCGAASLKIIFKYAGVDAEFPVETHNEILSLFRLQQLATEAGLTAKAVRMDQEHLRSTTSPSILHVMTEDMQPHFIVHFGYNADLALYLIADPDGQVGYLTEAELDFRWQSRAALYFENLQTRVGWRVMLYPWTYLFQFDFVPGIIWFAVPLLNVCGALLGLGATLVVEKAISPVFLSGGIGFMTLVFALLSFLSLAKCGLNYVKERLVINLAGVLDTTLYLQFVRPLERRLLNSGFLAKRFSEAIKDVQRIHQSVSMLIGGVLSDGLMVIILLTCLYFYFPGLVLIEMTAMFILILLTNRQLPFLLINSRSSSLPILTNEMGASASEPAVQEQLLADSIQANSIISGRSLRVSIQVNRLNLQYEAVSSLNLVIVLIYNIGALRAFRVSYPEFIFGVILCFAILNLATKICNQLFLVAQGAEMLAQQHRIYADNR